MINMDDAICIKFTKTLKLNDVIDILYKINRCILSIRKNRRVHTLVNYYEFIKSIENMGQTVELFVKLYVNKPDIVDNILYCVRSIGKNKSVRQSVIVL